VKETSFKSGVKGRGSDGWWERRWWLWWGDMRRMRWTRRTVRLPQVAQHAENERRDRTQLITAADRQQSLFADGTASALYSVSRTQKQGRSQLPTRRDIW